jgi:hypothetical protein
VVDVRPVPAHLRLGHIADDDWVTVKDRASSHPLLRMVRAIGPRDLSDRYAAAFTADPPGAGRDYCGVCHALSERFAAEGTRDLPDPAVAALLDREAARLQAEAGPVAFVRRHGCARYADLVAPAGRQEASTYPEVAVP